MTPELKDASTVILLRDAPTGLEVFLQRRVGGMAFAGGMTVFPGGGVDPSDRTPARGVDRWAGESPGWWADRFGTDEPTARALVLAAVRETFEECGVLFAGTTSNSLVADASTFAEQRRAVERREVAFGDFLVTADLLVRTDLIHPHARWITPEGETSRRYDTRFFVAAVPDGQVADDATSEAADASWVRPSDALDELRSGARAMLPPTWACLRRLAAADSVAAVLSADIDLSPIRPRLVTSGSAVRVDFDDAESYYADLP